jgi:hypothetical protein
LGPWLRETDQATSDDELGILQRFLKNSLHDIWRGLILSLKNWRLGADKSCGNTASFSVLSMCKLAGR